jgi:hypothetical protein
MPLEVTISIKGGYVMDIIAERGAGISLFSGESEN